MKTFNKVLVSKHNIKNNCYADDGEILIFPSEFDTNPKWLKKDDSFFVSLKNRTPSLYGWVGTLDTPISAESLIKMDYDSRNQQLSINESLLAKYEEFLVAINKYPEGTPMVSFFSEYGIMEKRRILKFEKVFFYKS